MRTCIIEKKLKDLEPYLHWGFSAALGDLVQVAQSILLCNETPSKSVEGLLKKLELSDLNTIPGVHRG